MKKISILIIFIALTTTTLAAIPPFQSYCEHQGHKIDYIENEEYCVFDDGNKCKLIEFYDKKCGQEYVKEFPCRESGEMVFGFEECCTGLEPYLPAGMLGQAHCSSISFFQKIMNFFTNIFTSILG